MTGRAKSSALVEHAQVANLLTFFSQIVPRHTRTSLAVFTLHAQELAEQLAEQQLGLEWSTIERHDHGCAQTRCCLA